MKCWLVSGGESSGFAGQCLPGVHGMQCEIHCQYCDLIAHMRMKSVLADNLKQCYENIVVASLAVKSDVPRDEMTIIHPASRLRSRKHTSTPGLTLFYTGYSWNGVHFAHQRPSGDGYVCLPTITTWTTATDTYLSARPHSRSSQGCRSPKANQAIAGATDQEVAGQST